MIVNARRVTPAKAVVQNVLKRLDSGLRRNDSVRSPRIGKTFGQLVSRPATTVVSILARSLPLSMMNTFSPDVPQRRCGISVAFIVVFDEEADSCNLLRRVLEGEGHHVTACSDSDAAFRLISQNPPDLVIAHIRSGKKGAVDLASRIKEISNRLAVMTISDYFSEAGDSIIGDAYLVKPVEIDVIETKVRELLASLGGADNSGPGEKIRKR